MKKNKLSLFKNVVKYTWRTSIFCYSTIFIHSSVNSLLNSYNDKEKCVYKHKRKNYFDFFATISLKTIPISYCSCQLAYNCDNNNVLPTETEYNNLELFKRLFFKLIQYEYFIIHKIISCINESIIFVLYSLANFYLYFHSAFFNICNLLSKIYHGQGNNGMLYTYPNIPYTIINSFVTIHKIYEHNRIPLKHDFKNDQLEYMGSGFIYDKRGHILTAAHNITNLEDKFVVKNSNGLYFATVLGLHKGSDVCVMKIDSKEPLSYISLDKIRDDLKQGEPVVTYGQIQNFDKETYSVGIVNHPKQTFTMFENFNENGQTTLYPFIQISNPINKGMSGSPLLDQHGNLVGMIQKKIDNYGLALPANILKNVAIHLQNNGVYKEPFLGIVFREKTFTIQNSRPLTKELKISSILANSPAALGSLKKEDIILKMNNKDIESICDVHEILNSANDGYINIDGVRNGKKFKTQSQIKSLDYPRTRIYENINKKEDLEYKAFKNVSFNKLKTSLRNFLVVNKKINISDVKHVSFLGKYYNYEKIDNYGVNEICILGRSNVGKSTFLRNFIKYLINVNDNTNIKVSKRSGCTRSINLYSFENAKRKKLFILTDMPGLGYAEGIGEKKMEYLKKNLDDYVYLRNQICLFFILIDMSVDIQKIDISLVDAIRKTGIPLRVICTKCDKFNGDVNHRLNGIKTFYKLEKTPIHISKFSNHNYINIFKEIQYHCNLGNSQS